MRISVVIPTFNRADSLPRALQSVLEQSSPVDEIIVVDDGSSDGSVKLIECDFPQVHLLQQDNQGVSAARNRGIEAARHEWIALLDSDDCWLPHKLERLRAAAAALARTDDPTVRALAGEMDQVLREGDKGDGERAETA